jgi:hypothetical protein
MAARALHNEPGTADSAAIFRRLRRFKVLSLPQAQLTAKTNEAGAGVGAQRNVGCKNLENAMSYLCV